MKPSPVAGPLSRFVRRRLHAQLATLRSGEIELREGAATSVFGRRGEPGLRAAVEVRHPAFYRRLATGGTLGAAESWLRGEWSASDLTALIRILLRDAPALGALDRGIPTWCERLLRPRQALRGNTRRGSRRNVAAHYDLGNDFFAAFLDPTLTYSAGIFERPDATMEEASLAKYERICRKLDLAPADHVLEIGTGWGGFCLHAAARHGCRVTTTTISPAQRALATERVTAAGLGDRVAVLGSDYRDLAGTFDKVVAIEMIEAVGHARLGSWFRACGARLAPGGRALVQAIVIRDQSYASARRTVDFIKRYVFPGGCLPSVGALVDAAARSSDLRLVHLEEIGPHYAETLRRWRSSLLENRARILALGYPERLLRIFEFYFDYCEAGFEERHIGAAQLVFERPGSRADPILGAV
jgi:cyclopropane-fatty-acyl-phospholipid synthase